MAKKTSRQLGLWEVSLKRLKSGLLKTQLNFFNILSGVRFFKASKNDDMFFSVFFVKKADMQAGAVPQTLTCIELF